MARPRAVLVSALIVICLVWGAPAFARGGTSGSNVTAGSVAGNTVATDQVTDSTVGWRLENDPSQCINSNPRPNCGYKPQDAGERGGWLQITVFLVLMAALGLIFTVIIRNVVRRDRAVAERMQSAVQQGTPGGESPQQP